MFVTAVFVRTNGNVLTGTVNLGGWLMPRLATFVAPAPLGWGLVIDHSCGTGSGAGAVQPAKNNSAPPMMNPLNLNTRQLCGTRNRTQAVSEKSSFLAGNRVGRFDSLCPLRLVCRVQLRHDSP